MGLCHFEEELNGAHDDGIADSQCHCGSSSRC